MGKKKSKKKSSGIDPILVEVAVMLDELLCECENHGEPPVSLSKAIHTAPCLKLAVTTSEPSGAFKGWSVVTLSEKSTDRKWDVIVGEKDTPEEVVLSVVRNILRMFNAGELDVPVATIRRIQAWLAAQVAVKAPLKKNEEPAAPTPPKWVDELNDKAVVLVDLDGTLYDAMACHGIRGNHRSSDGCTHVRKDTLAIVHDICERNNAVPVVLSWRSGMYDLSRDWSNEIGLGQVAVCVPSSPDSKGLEVGDSFGFGQVGFKKKVANSLMSLGVKIVASFDDNDEVCEMMRGLGVPEVHHIPRLVTLEPHEWAAGRIGAPKPSRNYGSYSSGVYSSDSVYGGYGTYGSYGTQDRLFGADEYYGGLTDGFDDELETGFNDMLMTRETFDEMIEFGEAIQGKHYMLDDNGEVVPLVELVEDWDAVEDPSADDVDDYDAEQLAHRPLSSLEDEMNDLIDEISRLEGLRQAIADDLAEQNWAEEEREFLEADMYAAESEIADARRLFKICQRAVQMKKAVEAKHSTSMTPREEAEWRAEQLDGALVAQVAKDREALLAKKREDRARRNARKSSPKNATRRAAKSAGRNKVAK